MKVYRFVREYGGWYIDLPDYLAQGGSKGDLAMVAGADTMLDIMSAGGEEVRVALETQPFGGADLLELVEVCPPSVGGGYYVLHTYRGQPIEHRMWLCEVVLYVFGHLPERVFLQQVS